MINNSNFNSLDGLDKLSEVTTLDLSNNKLDGLTTYTDETGQKKTIDTCQYIVQSLPKLNEVTLKGNSGSGLKNFSYLTNHGFNETGKDTEKFNKS